MSLLSVKNLSVGYEGKSVAKNINFELNEGDYLCILGENGAGKSTLVKTLLQLQKPIDGTINYESDGIGYLPQQTIVQKDCPATVWEIVLSGNLKKLGRRPFYSVKEKKIAKENMIKMDIWEIKNMCYRNLSGGQQQRVLLARALCASTKILFLDEPVTGLDPKVTKDFCQTIKKLNEEGMTIIMVSHDVFSAVEYATHILQVDGGDNFFGTVDEYEKSDAGKSFGILKEGK